MVRFLLALATFCITFTTAANEAPVHVASTLNANGTARIFSPLPAYLAGLPLEVRIHGWKPSRDAACEALPAWLTVTVPAPLPPADPPALVGTARVSDLAKLPGTFTLCGTVRTPVSVHALRWSVEPPPISLFVLNPPDRVVASTQETTVVPLRVRNVGASAGVAELAFRGASITAPATRIPAGGRVDVPVTIPPTAAGTHLVTVAIAGDARTSGVTFTLVSGNGRNAGAFGVTLRAQAGFSATRGWSAASFTTPTLAVTGRLAPQTSIDLAVGGEGVKGSLTHYGTRLRLNEKMNGAAGQTTNGLYLEQRVASLPGVTLGVAVPYDAPPRAGLRVHRDGFGLNLDSDTRGDLAVAASYGTREAYGRVHLTPKRAQRLEVTATTYSRPFSVRLKSSLVREWRHEIGVRYQPIQAERASERLEFSAKFQGTTLREYDLTLRGHDNVFSWVTRSASRESVLSWSTSPALPGARLHLKTDLVLHDPAFSKVTATANTTVGAWSVDAGLAVSALPDLAFDLNTRRAFHAPYGRHDVAFGATGESLLRRPSGTLTLDYGLVTLSGLTLDAAAELPIPGFTTAPAVSIGVGWAVHLGVPPALTETLTAADATERRLHLQLFDGTTTTPLAGLRLQVCGESHTADAAGTIVIRNDPRPCPVSLARTEAPYNIVTNDFQEFVLEAGMVRTVVLRKRVEATILATWIDPATRTPVPYRATRTLLTLTDQETHEEHRIPLDRGEGRAWLPAGRYVASIAGETLGDLLVADSSPSLAIAVPFDTRTLQRDVAPPRIRLENGVVRAGGTATITVTSELPIASVTALLEKRTSTGDAALETEWHVELPIPHASSGLLAVQVRVILDDETVHERRLHVMVGD